MKRIIKYFLISFFAFIILTFLDWIIFYNNYPFNEAIKRLIYLNIWEFGIFSAGIWFGYYIIFREKQIEGIK